ncbi:hypothetical protein EFY79_00865 [Hanamia caeni]|jgi:hypothetical protein|uniref:Uncharacterized protein n=1 Tax=Hanamia caeni TaxID=2294116 RepID=A0A3M9NRG1_9BACT|nr:hypothetical protein [Hanamia caeni]RNI39887.1 hypothetical protein EFY79_00865 [Hanamia caeni]
MESTASFRVIKSELLNALKQIQRVEKSTKKKLSTLDVTLIDGLLQMAIPGIQLNIIAATKGSAKFTVRLWYFTDIIKSERDNTLHFELTENRLSIRKLSFPVLTTFFETDRILRSINLPLNYTDMDLVKLLLSGKYTDEEIVFNDLDKEALTAMRRVKADISKIILMMKAYGFKRKEVEELIQNKLKENENG